MKHGIRGNTGMLSRYLSSSRVTRLRLAARNAHRTATPKHCAFCQAREEDSAYLWAAYLPILQLSRIWFVVMARGRELRLLAAPGTVLLTASATGGKYTAHRAT